MHNVTHTAATDRLSALGWDQPTRCAISNRLSHWGPGRSATAVNMLVASKLSPTQATDLLTMDWTSPTSLRHTITKLRQSTVTTTSVTTTPVSNDARAAATESLWASYRLDGGPAPTRYDVVQLARRMDEKRLNDAVRANSDNDDDNGCDNNPKVSKGDQARAALAAATMKTKAPKFSGVADVDVVFNDEGTVAMVPSSQKGAHPYTVKLADGVPYSCTCKHHAYGAHLCKHMIATTNAYWICAHTADPKRKVKVRLTPVKRTKRLRLHRRAQAAA